MSDAIEEARFQLASELDEIVFGELERLGFKRPTTPDEVTELVELLKEHQISVDIEPSVQRVAETKNDVSVEFQVRLGYTVKVVRHKVNLDEL